MTEECRSAEKYRDSLIKAWEQYLKIIDIIIALSGATSLVIVNMLNKIGKELLHSKLLLVTFVSFAIALFLLAFWRFSAQYFYKYETIGSKNDAENYFKYYGIKNPVTQVFKENDTIHSFYKFAYKLTAYGSGLFLATTWFCFLFIIFKYIIHP